jgi:hypothetical protein
MVAHEPTTDRPRSDETETKLHEETIEILRCANSKFQKEIDVATMECQNLMKENEKICIVARTAKQENVKLKYDNEILLDTRKQLIPTNAKLTAGEEYLQDTNSKIQKEIDVATMECQNLMKETRNYASLSEQRWTKTRN